MAFIKATCSIPKAQKMTESVTISLDTRLSCGNLKFQAKMRTKPMRALSLDFRLVDSIPLPSNLRNPFEILISRSENVILVSERDQDLAVFDFTTRKYKKSLFANILDKSFQVENSTADYLITATQGAPLAKYVLRDLLQNENASAIWRYEEQTCNGVSVHDNVFCDISVRYGRKPEENRIYTCHTEILGVVEFNAATGKMMRVIMTNVIDPWNIHFNSLGNMVVTDGGQGVMAIMDITSQSKDEAIILNKFDVKNLATPSNVFVDPVTENIIVSGTGRPYAMLILNSRGECLKEFTSLESHSSGLYLDSFTGELYVLTDRRISIFK